MEPMESPLDPPLDQSGAIFIAELCTKKVLKYWHNVYCIMPLIRDNCLPAQWRCWYSMPWAISSAHRSQTLNWLRFLSFCRVQHGFIWDWLHSWLLQWYHQFRIWWVNWHNMNIIYIIISGFCPLRDPLSSWVGQIHKLYQALIHDNFHNQFWWPKRKKMKILIRHTTGACDQAYLNKNG